MAHADPGGGGGRAGEGRRRPADLEKAADMTMKGSTLDNVERRRDGEERADPTEPRPTLGLGEQTPHKGGRVMESPSFHVIGQAKEREERKKG